MVSRRIETFLTDLLIPSKFHKSTVDMKIRFLSHQKDKKQDDFYKKMILFKTRAKSVLVLFTERQQLSHVLKRLKKVIFSVQASSLTMKIPR